MTPYPHPLHAAYTGARYRLRWRRQWLELRVGAHSAALERALRQVRAWRWAFITASNPGSRRLAPFTNALRRLALRDYLQRCHWHPLPAVSEGEAWPTEYGFWIAHMSAPQALHAGQHFGQAAVLYGARGSTPTLLWCRTKKWGQTPFPN